MGISLAMSGISSLRSSRMCSSNFALSIAPALYLRSLPAAAFTTSARLFSSA